MKKVKTDFIKNELTALVKRACSNVKELVPIENNRGDVDYVRVVYNNNYYTMTVNIMCDSLLAIARDVLKRI